MGIYSLSLQSSPSLLIVLQNFGTPSLGNRERDNSQIIARNKLAYFVVVKAHHMARKLHSTSEYVQKDVQQATAEQVSDLIRATDGVDQVRGTNYSVAIYAYVSDGRNLSKVIDINAYVRQMCR